jgi:hypothetical protein
MNTHNYVVSFKEATRKGDTCLLKILLEEHPSIVNDPQLRSKLVFAYRHLIHEHPSSAKRLYDAVSDSTIPDRKALLLRFDVMDRLALGIDYSQE